MNDQMTNELVGCCWNVFFFFIFFLYFSCLRNIFITKKGFRQEVELRRSRNNLIKFMTNLF